MWWGRTVRPTRTASTGSNNSFAPNRRQHLNARNFYSQTNLESVENRLPQPASTLGRFTQIEPLASAIMRTMKCPHCLVEFHDGQVWRSVGLGALQGTVSPQVRLTKLQCPTADRLGQIHVQGINLLGGGIAQDERRVIGS
jgi:hypothetical protein